MMQSFQERFRFLCFVLAGLILVWSCPQRVFAKDGGQTKNVGFKVTGQVVEIYYDLIATTDQMYDVSVVMKKRFDKTFSYTPIAVSGDVGTAVIPGENRRISWKLTDEFPNGLPGEDCFFVVEASASTGTVGGISTLVWVAGGAAVVGGVILAIALSGKKNTDGGNSVFPPPPVRP